MNAYVMTADRVHVVEGAGWLEVHPDAIVLIRSSDPQRRPMAAVKLSDDTWVAVGDRPPAHWPEAAPEAAPAAVVTRTVEWPSDAPPILVGDGGWPPEPPPDVDSEH